MRTVSPLDMDTVLKSVGKTKRLAVADPGWQSVGVAAEIISSVCERIGPELLSAPIRVCLPDSHTPMTAKLEAQYYPTDDSIAEATRNLMRSVPVKH
jgi:pyruvate dehydrogenase E1 component beta subunit